MTVLYEALLEDCRAGALDLLPTLRYYCDKGWPGLTERDRHEATDALWDLETTLLDLNSVKQKTEVR